MYFSALNGSGIDPTQYFREITFTSVVSFAIAFAWLLLAKNTILKATAVKPLVGRTLFVFFIAYVLRACVFSWIIVLTGATENGDLLYRLSVSFPTFGFGLLICAYIVSLGREFSRARAHLANIQKETLELSENGTERITEHRREMVEYIRNSLGKEIKSTLGGAPQAALERIRSTIDQFVRPLSLHLVTNVPHFDIPERPVDRSILWSTVIKNVLQENPIRPLWFALWVGIVAFTFSVTRMPILVTLIYTSAIFTSGFVGLLVVNWGWKWVASRKLVVRVVYFTVGISVAAVFVNYVARLVPEHSQMQQGLLFAYSFISLGIAWFVAILFSLRNQLNHVQTLVAQASHQLREVHVILNIQIREQRLAISSVLHGNIQDQITVAAFRISEASSAGTVSEEFLANLAKPIENAIDEIMNATPHSVDLLRSVDELRQLWNGIVAIELHITAEVEQLLREYPASSITVNEVIREACANAIRHGQADEISISVVRGIHSACLDVTVTNNGAPLMESERLGVGSILLDELTLRWDRYSENGKTILTAQVPLVESHSQIA